jgi:lysozyme
MRNFKTRSIASISLLAFTGIGLFFTPKATGHDSWVTISAAPHYPSFGVEIPADYNVHGIDVSRHQGNIDWDAVSKMSLNEISVDFAFIKASEGRTVVDEYFKSNWKEAKGAGIMRGAYHFYRTHLTPQEQIDLFVRQVPKLEKGDLPPVLDIEIKGSCPPARLRKNLKTWLVLAEKHYLNTSEFKKYPLWLAHYKTADLNQKTSNWHFWQHTDKAKVNGIRGGVDFNVFKGDQDDLKSLCKK